MRRRGRNVLMEGKEPRLYISRLLRGMRVHCYALFVEVALELVTVGEECKRIVNLSPGIVMREILLLQLNCYWCCCYSSHLRNCSPWKDFGILFCCYCWLLKCKRRRRNKSIAFRPSLKVHETKRNRSNLRRIVQSAINSIAEL